METAKIAIFYNQTFLNAPPKGGTYGVQLYKHFFWLHFAKGYYDKGVIEILAFQLLSCFLYTILKSNIESLVRIRTLSSSKPLL